ncbi:DUF3265 domain-containing protein [Vibrio alginolyticus]|nr:DUF3265 domain-containing protein [Vibrio alginolyticus]
MATHLTNCSRGIRNAWHFHYALIFGDLGGLRRVRYCVAPPLTGR